MIEILPNWHPLFVHFTVALYFTAGLLLLLGKYAGGQHWGDSMIKAAHINLWLGGLLTIITLGAGFHAYMTVAHDAVSHQAMTNHRNWAWMTVPFLFIVSGWSASRCCKAKQFNPLFYILLLLGLLMLAVTAFKGGELVYRYGVGVKTTQFTSSESGQDGHAHEHTEKNPVTESDKTLQPVYPQQSEEDDHGTHAH